MIWLAALALATVAEESSTTTHPLTLVFFDADGNEHEVLLSSTEIAGPRTLIVEPSTGWWDHTDEHGHPVFLDIPSDQLLISARPYRTFWYMNQELLNLARSDPELRAKKRAYVSSYTRRISRTFALWFRADLPDRALLVERTADGKMCVLPSDRVSVTGGTPSLRAAFRLGSFLGSDRAGRLIQRLETPGDPQEDAIAEKIGVFFAEGLQDTDDGIVWAYRRLLDQMPHVVQMRTRRILVDLDLPEDRLRVLTQMPDSLVWREIQAGWDAFWQEVDRSTLSEKDLVRLDEAQEKGRIPPSHFVDAVGHLQPKAAILPDAQHITLDQLGTGLHVEHIERWEDENEFDVVAELALEGGDAYPEFVKRELDHPHFVRQLRMGQDQTVIPFDPPLEVKVNPHPVTNHTIYPDDPADPAMVSIVLDAQVAPHERARCLREVQKWVPSSEIPPLLMHQGWADVVLHVLELPRVSTPPLQYEDYLVVEYMPAYLRQRDRGVYPYNGAVRVILSREIAERAQASNPDWFEVLGVATPDAVAAYELSPDTALMEIWESEDP